MYSLAKQVNVREEYTSEKMNGNGPEQSIEEPLPRRPQKSDIPEFSCPRRSKLEGYHSVFAKETPCPLYAATRTGTIEKINEKSDREANRDPSQYSRSSSEIRQGLIHVRRNHFISSFLFLHSHSFVGSSHIQASLGSWRLTNRQKSLWPFRTFLIKISQVLS